MKTEHKCPRCRKVWHCGIQKAFGQCGAANDVCPSCNWRERMFGYEEFRRMTK